MVKHTQTIRRQQPTDCSSVFDHFVKLALKGLISLYNSAFGELYEVLFLFIFDMAEKKSC